MCIVILNTNGWRDTIECLESVRQLDYPNFEVVVCDNGSTDGSWSRLVDWAESNAGGPTPEGDRFPSAYQSFETPGALREIGAAGPSRKRLTLIQNGANLGFGAGNNPGIRYALERTDVGYVWLLNNDTVVTPGALSALVARFAGDSRLGICGSTLIYYHDRRTVQAYAGARYNHRLSRGDQIGLGTPFQPATDAAQVEKELDYVTGASLLASREFLLDVGLLAEHYFLYYDDSDWAERAKGQFTLGFAPASVVYHKEGATIGSSSRSRPSLLSLYYMTRNAPRFYRRYHPVWLPIVYLNLAYSSAKRFATGHFDEGILMVRALLGIGMKKSQK